MNPDRGQREVKWVRNIIIRHSAIEQISSLILITVEATRTLKLRKKYNKWKSLDDSEVGWCEVFARSPLKNIPTAFSATRCLKIHRPAMRSPCNAISLTRSRMSSTYVTLDESILTTCKAKIVDNWIFARFLYNYVLREELELPSVQIVSCKL